MSSKFLGNTTNVRSLAQEVTLEEMNDKMTNMDVTITNTVDTNLTEINGTSAPTGNGINNDSLRVTIALDNQPFPVVPRIGTFQSIMQEGTGSSTADGGKAIQRVSLITDQSEVASNLTQLNGIALSVNNGTANSSTQRVVIASNQTPFDINDLATMSGAEIAMGPGIASVGLDRAQRTVSATDSPNLNNFSNWYMRSGQNTGTPDIFSGTIASVATTAFRQMSQGFGDDTFYVNPTGADVDLQISCDSVTHTTQTLEVEAWQQDGTIITSDAVTLNGQTAVNITFPASAQVFRIRKLLVLTNTMANGIQTGGGDIVYISLQSQSLTLGVPDDNIMMSMNLGHGIMRFGGQYYVPPNAVFYLVSANFSADSDSNRATRIALKIKESTATLWFIEFISGVRNSQEFHLPSSNKIEGGTEGMDIRILVSEGDGTGTISNAFTSFHGILE